MKKVVVMLSLAMSMFCLSACAKQAVPDLTTTEAIVTENVTETEDVAGTEVVETEDVADDVNTTLKAINAEVLAAVDATAEADVDFDKLQEIAKEFDGLKNQYLNVMLNCNDDQTELKKQVQKTLKALPTSIAEDTDEAKAAFVEKASLVTEAVTALEALMN